MPCRDTEGLKMRWNNSISWTRVPGQISIDLTGLTVTHVALCGKPLFHVAISMSCNTKLKAKFQIFNPAQFHIQLHLYFFGINAIECQQ
jgi:hypothetical protein